MISLVGTYVLVHGFSALLPPISDDEVDYYEIMGLSPNCSQDDVRKAYKKISLKLHPDKVAQRGGNVEEAREEYQHVQEANSILSNPNKRRRYDILQRSPRRFQFVSTGMNPGAMYENLSKASFFDKSRLVFLAVLLCCIVLLQPILMCAKMNQDLRQEGILYNTTWVVVLIPWWLVYGLVVMAQLVVFCITKQVLFGVAFLEHAAWFVGEFFIAQRWDRTIMWDYKIVFIPIYVALFLRWTHKILRLSAIHNALQRMVTLEYIEQHVLSGGRTYQDLTEDEMKEIAQQYVVVHVPPMAARLEDEEEKVRASPEYEKAVDVYTELVNSLIAGVVISTTFVALVVAKVDGAITASWWIVFVPIWVSLGVKILASVYSCCCMPTLGEEVIGENDVENENGEEEKEDGNDGFEDRKEDSIFASVEGSIRAVSQQNELDAQESTATGEAKSSTDNASKKTGEAESSVKTDSKQGGNGVQQVENVKDSDAKEETKEPDVVEEIPTGNDEWSGIHIDDDMFREFESAYQEAEESAMEEQAKSQADCCSAIFQLMMLCLLVGKLQRDYMRGENEKPGYNAFWILFPIFLVFGCAFCTCACLIYTAGESQGFDHLVERATQKDEENADAPQEGADGDAATATKNEAADETKQEETKEQPAEATEQDSDMHDLD